MKKYCNKTMEHSQKGVLVVMVHLFPSNLSFCGLSDLDTERFKRCGTSLEPILWVEVNSSDDFVIEQISNLLSAPIKDVDIDAFDRLNEDNFDLFAQLLHGSTIDKLRIKWNLQDIPKSFIFYMASRANELTLEIPDAPGIWNPLSFITQLYSLGLPMVRLISHNPRDAFFGIPHSAWENYLNEKLSSGSLEYVRTQLNPENITNAPINPPDERIRWLEWKMVEAE
ncbi:hypothetical protein PMAYCL1PPCAC_27463 [Pristionchus mayeri]|uniref:Uncharacterized protein n=1 Tax=Pristionchus mayeri TaxID=1317129 RepID=A0AAN5I953_9BILA|nr:hypothetical protein PMAYCL1PPCAC_27463 [Pristionchus mayeri]